MAPCKGNPGPGGWAWVQLEGDTEVGHGAGGDVQTTNNKMELMAVIQALQHFPDGIALNIHTDSSYVSKGATQWLARWKRSGWRTVDKKSVANRDLWMELDGLLDGRIAVFTWVKGHTDVTGNILADRYAQEQAVLFANTTKTS